MTHRVVLIAGDGIGPEVSEAVLRIIKVAGVAIDWEPYDVHLPRELAAIKVLEQAATGAAR